jgi:membrane-bound serine protease (ClpP class)
VRTLSTYGPTSRRGRSIAPSAMRRQPGTLRRVTLRIVAAASFALLALVPLLGAQLLDAAPAAAAQPAGTTDRVDVIEVSGLLDPVLADFVERSITRAENDGVVAITLRVNSGGAVLDADRFDRLAARIANASVPVAAWVGPTGSKATGRVAQLLARVDDLGMSPGTKIGDLGDIVVPGGLAGTPFASSEAGLVERTLSAEEAEAAGLARTTDGPTLGQFIAGVKGVQTSVETVDGKPQTRILSQVAFAKLPISSRLFHTVSSPEVAYLLFVIGMALLVFELFTAGVGIAGVVGVGCFVLGCYGLDVLPARWWAVALLVFSMFGFSVDIQTGVPRAWTGIATAAFVIGSALLYDGVTMSWITLIAGVVGILLAMIGGMPTMVRTRFSTPTIGREWMVGEAGQAVGSVDPDGVVRVREALWKARTNRATPIEAGQGVRVVSIEGLTLEVEPAEGGARDHRERRR